METLLVYSIAPLFVLACLHFIYEGLIAPTLRLTFRFGLFAVRDELRWMIITHEASQSDQVYECLHDFINSAISRLDRFDIASLAAFRRRMATDPKLKARVLERLEKTTELIEQCPIARIGEMYALTQRYIYAGLYVNTGGWALYVLPVLASLYLHERIKRLVLKVLMAPNRLYDVISPLPSKTHPSPC